MFMDRFHVAGWRRWVFVEPFSECASLGAGGLVVMLALALPAIRETAADDSLIKATLATEDRRFYEHFGIDFPGLVRAMLTNARAGGVVQGGSSITQQLAKNLFLTNERTLERKIKEALRAREPVFLSSSHETEIVRRQIGLEHVVDRNGVAGVEGYNRVAVSVVGCVGKHRRESR